MKVHAPGKLILSGEYSVLYGKPALAMAINRYVSVHIKRGMLPNIFPRIFLDLSSLAHRSSLSMRSLQKIKQRIKSKYQRFVAGHFHIRDVLQKPFELAQFTLSMMAETFNLSLLGICIKVESTLPVGCGMGSSAATILSVMHAVALYGRLSISKDDLLQLAKQAENMQHGYSSGLDLHTALQGGCIYYMPGQAPIRRDLRSPSMYFVHTGCPITSTGECVAKVMPFFEDPSLAEAFSVVTNTMDAAIQAEDINGFKYAIRENHRLLVRIGVVPLQVQHFIRSVELQGGVAKICGAGSISGEHAGAVLVLTDDVQHLNRLCQQFSYSCAQMICSSRGLHAN